MESDEFINEEIIRKKNSEYMLKIGNLLSTSCPAASRFYMCSFERNLCGTPDLLKAGKHAHRYCRKCGSLWAPGNYRVRVKSCPSLNHHLRKLIKIAQVQPWKLNNHQKKKLKKFQEATNKIVYSCFTCKKKTEFPGDKKCKINYRAITSSHTPLPKINPKKSDLNAGLFIPSPSCLNTTNNSDSSKSSIKTPVIAPPSPNGMTYHEEQSSSVTPKTMNISLFKSKASSFNYQTPTNVKTKAQESGKSSAQKLSAAKKKKTLLDEILKQGQNSKKKPSLASFLVSL